MLHELIVEVSTGRKAHVTFQNRQVGTEIRILCDVRWTGESSGSENEELGLAVQSLIQNQFPNLPMQANSTLVRNEREFQEIAKRHLGIGDN